MKRLLMMLLFAGGLLVLQQTAASAADFTVNSNLDAADASPGNGVCATAAGVCTLRAAVMEAEALSGTDTITVPAMTITLGSQITLTKTTTIRGSGARSTIVTGTPGHILFAIGGGDVVIRDLAMQGATATNGAGLAIQQTGPAASKLIGVRVANNSITAGVSQGYGPVYVTAGEMEIRDSSITGNSTRSSGNVWGGGVFVYGSGTRLLVENSTIHGNTVTSTASNAYGGGIASTFNSTTTIRSSTITNNTAANTSSISGLGGNLLRDAPMTVENSIVSGGAAAFSTYLNCYGPIDFTGRNLVSDTTCGAATANRLITDPQLGPIADNGGGTDTRAPSVSSPALDAATSCARRRINVDRAVRSAPRVTSARWSSARISASCRPSPTRLRRPVPTSCSPSRSRTRAWTRRPGRRFRLAFRGPRRSPRCHPRPAPALPQVRR